MKRVILCAVFLMAVFISSNSLSSESYSLYLQAKNQSSWSPIHWATVYGVDWAEDSTVQMLLDKGADIEAKDSYGRTPLHLAIDNDRLEIARLLIKNKANIEAKNKNGNTVLINAAMRRSKEAVKLLVDSGADLDAKDDRGDTALEIIWKPEYDEEKILELARPLIEEGANIKTRNWQDLTIFQRAIINRWFDAAKLLLDKKADIEVKNEHNQTILHIVVMQYHSRKNNNTDGIEFLLKHGADTNQADKEGNTALHIAAMKADTKVANLLIDKNANPVIANKQGKTPLDNATLMQNHAMIKLLTKATNDRSIELNKK